MLDRIKSSRASDTQDQRTSLFVGPGEMKGRCRTFDWAASALGPVEGWPQSLRTIVTTILDSAFPNIVLWGPELIQIYNDGYREVMGAKHPLGLGIPTRDCWPEAWGFNQPIYERVLRGETVFFEDVLIPLMRYGALEDVYFTLSYSPLRAESHAVAGVLVTLLETTARVAARQLEAERALLLQRVEVERNRLSEIFRQSPGFFALLRGPAHVFELANDAYFQLVGHRHILGRPVAEALPEVKEQGFIDLLDQVLATGESVSGQEVPVLLTRTPGAEPEQRFVNFLYQAIDEADATRSGVLAHGADVTEQVLARREVERLLKASEESRRSLDTLNAELAESRQRLSDVFQQAPVAVAVLTGPTHVYTIASPAYARYLGGRPLLGRAFREAVPEIGGQRVAELMDLVYETGEPVTRTQQVVPLDRDGDGVLEEYLFDVSYQPLRNAAGEVYAITSSSLDVTDQVRARRLADEAAQAIADARQQLERVFSQAPVAIAVLEGGEHRFRLANAHYQALVGRTNLLGRTARDVFPELAGQGIFEILDDVFRTGKAFVANELSLSIRRGPDTPPEQAFFNFTYQPLHSVDGEVYGIGAVAVDVSDQVRARQYVEQLLRESEASRAALQSANAQLEEQQIELELANQQLQDNAAEMEAQTAELETQTEELEEQTRVAREANRAKSDFLATMSHELRTPLNAIGGYADLLLGGVRGELSDIQRLDVERMRRSGQHLLGLINSLLNFTKLDAGEINFDVRPVALNALLDGVPDLVAPQLASKSLRFTISGCASDTMVMADVDKTRQVLLNLLSNAVKFTSEGGAITLSCTTDSDWVQVRVDDTGRGIAPENIQRVFDAFVQVDRHLTPHSQQGVGLGLAISRDLAVGMGGQLSVASTLGVGSTFTLSLRRAQ
ncbi:MAG: cph1A [Gemmatimonadetes bacterium]|nr:cph1A [Gemmatimonadota bacterium]